VKAPHGQRPDDRHERKRHDEHQQDPAAERRDHLAAFLGL
jgi:hypothetical protein